MLIANLFQHPQLIDSVATLIYDEFWADVVDGMSHQRLVAHLKTASAARQIPLCLIALVDDRLAGCVNLIENDDEKRTHLRPWLAAMVVSADLRGQGIGTALVTALLEDARVMRIPAVFFGTDGPGFYRRLGAIVHEPVRDDFAVMKFKLAGI